MPEPRTWTIWTNAKGGESSLWRKRGVRHAHRVVEVGPDLEAMIADTLRGYDEMTYQPTDLYAEAIVARIKGDTDRPT
jgi:hypothetical protein